VRSPHFSKGNTGSKPEIRAENALLLTHFIIRGISGGLAEEKAASSPLSGRILALMRWKCGKIIPFARENCCLQQGILGDLTGSNHFLCWAFELHEVHEESPRGFSWFRRFTCLQHELVLDCVFSNCKSLRGIEHCALNQSLRNDPRSPCRNFIFFTMS
jgi:hypothetical protein